MTGSEQEKLSHLRACRVPEREAQFVAAGVPDNDAVRAVRDFTASPKTFCLLMGGAGSGKTVAAAEALLGSRMVWASGWSYSPSEAKFAIASDLSRMSYFDIESQRRLGRLERVPWLVLDDLGSELMTPGWASNLGEVVMTRNSARRKTYITTNLTLEAFRERYDERVLSRIRGDGVVIGFGAQDLRRGAA